MPKIRNPAQNTIDLTAVKTRVTALLSAKPVGDDLDFADVRANMGLDAAALPDGHIHQAALDLGLIVEVDPHEGGIASLKPVRQ